MPTASLEALVWQLRVHDDGGFGSPFSVSCTVVGDLEQTALLRGLNGKLTPERWKAMCAALLAEGFVFALYERKSPTGTRLVKVDLTTRKFVAVTREKD